MKIALCQICSEKGNIKWNMDRHILFVHKTIAFQANLIVFPELSLTGYEPSLAKHLAIGTNDTRLQEIQSLCDKHNITVSVGAPTKSGGLPKISMIIMQSQKKPQLYSKQYLHEDEEPFFEEGPAGAGIIGTDPKIALAICYEISVNEHSKEALANGAELYLASVAKFQNGIAPAKQRLKEIANEYKIPVLMVNAVGMADGQRCAGNTLAYDRKGILLGQMDSAEEGILFYDTDLQKVDCINMEQ